MDKITCEDMMEMTVEEVYAAVTSGKVPVEEFSSYLNMLLAIGEEVGRKEAQKANN